MKTAPHYLLLSFLLCLSACALQKKSVSTPTGSVEALQQLMTGTFDSSAQAAADSNYFNISLQMYPIWKNRPGTWLYVEQAVAANPDQPYRQRVYQLEKVDDQTFASHVYTLKYEKEMIGQWKKPAAFDVFGAEKLEKRKGCTIYLTIVAPDHYKGSTRHQNCKSTLRGASYATSEVAIFKDKIVSWDQGFDVDGKQVWGATEGGYVFDKK